MAEGLRGVWETFWRVGGPVGRPGYNLFRSSGPRRDDAYCFVLLELILAVAIAGIVGVALFASLDIAFDARRQAVDQLAGRNAARITLDLISADLQSLLPPRGLLAGPLVGGSEYTTSGRDGDWIQFTTAATVLATPQQKGDLRLIELRLANDPDQSGCLLLVRVVTTNLLATIEREPIVQILARHAVAFNLRYYDGADWVDQWNSVDRGDALPQAIEITVTLRPPRANAPDPTSLFDDEGTLTMTRLVMPAAAERTSTLGPGTAR